MKQKKILLLGGGFFQVPSVISAKKLGYKTITCDYLPDNPGHQYADEYYNVSTTDLDAVLKLAISLKIDGILCYASDVSAITAAYVAEKMGLYGNPLSSVEILSKKDLFRKFLAEHQFRTPIAASYSSADEARDDFDRFQFPVMVKPTDSCGSKGVSRLDSLEKIDDAFQFALKFSREKRVIVEEYVPNHGPQIIGDGITKDGKLIYRQFGAHFFNQVKDAGNPFVPSGGIWRLNRSDEIHQRIHNEIQRLLTLLNMGNSAYNFEVRLTEDDQPILMEAGCRNGGNMIPQVLEFATGVDMVEYVIRTAMGEEPKPISQVEPDGIWAYYVVHSNRRGILRNIQIAEEFRSRWLKHFWQRVYPGELVRIFTGAYASLGTMALRFDSYDEAESVMNNAEKYIQIELGETGEG